MSHFILPCLTEVFKGIRSPVGGRKSSLSSGFKHPLCCMELFTGHFSSLRKKLWSTEPYYTSKSGYKFAFALVFCGCFHDFRVQRFQAVALEISLGSGKAESSHLEEFIHPYGEKEEVQCVF